MSFNTFTAALNIAEFPFVSNFLQRPILIPGLDIPPRVPRSDTGTFESKNPELPMHFFVQNVLPSVEGLMSIGYQQIVAAIPGTTDFDQVIVLRDFDENNFLYVPAAGKNYIFRADVGNWVATNSFSAAGGRVTRAFVNGRTFVCFEKQGIFEYDSAANTFLPVTTTGLAAADIEGISASSNYLLAWVNSIEIHWSSLVDPLDFVESIFTGAGFQIPQDVRGPIINIVPISGGFIAYTTKNAVAALFTNNTRAPWVFKEISNTGGIIDPEQVSLEATLGFHYAWTSAGLQKITANLAEAVGGGISDFLAGRILETFDSTANTLTVERLTSEQFHVKISYVSGRYLVISYGKHTSIPQTYSLALVFDTVLKRWGKLAVEHVDCFTYPYPNIIGQVTESPPKQSLAFLQKDGTVLLAVMDYRTKEDAGVLFLGRFQLARQRTITFQAVEFENLIQDYPPNVYLYLSDDGRNLGTPQQLQVLSDSGNYKKYGAPSYSGSGAAPRRTAKSFAVLIKGTFELSASMFTVTIHGTR